MTDPDVPVVIEDQELRPEDREKIAFLVERYYPPLPSRDVGFSYVHGLHWYMAKLWATVKALEAEATGL